MLDPALGNTAAAAAAAQLAEPAPPGPLDTQGPAAELAALLENCRAEFARVAAALEAWSQKGLP